MFAIRPESPDQPDVATLLVQADERSAAMYPAESRHGFSAAALIKAEARFFVARQDGRAVGCGGYVLLQDESAELKRLFVCPSARGRGLGRSIVLAIEAAAVEEGVGVMFLETGVKSHEAIRLYTALGFATRGPFGAYSPDRLSIFMAKPLSPPEFGSGLAQRRGV